MVYYFAQNATIEAYNIKEDTYEIVGAVQECSFEWNVEDVKLYQFGTIKRADASRHSASVNVTVKLAKFGSPTSGNDWFWAILNGEGWKATGTGTTPPRKVTVSDTTNFPMFKIAGQFRPTNGETDDVIYVEVTEVYFKTFQWGASLGEYIMENLEGEGADIVFSTSAPEKWVTENFGLAVEGDVPVVVAVDADKTVNLNISGDNHTYNAGTANGAIASAVIACDGVITVSGISAGETVIFAAVDGKTISIPVTVVGE